MDPLQDETFQLKIDDAWKQELQETPEVLFVPSAPPTVSTDFLPIESAITTTGTLNVTELNTGTSLDVSEISINDDQQQQAEGAPGNVEDEIPRVTVVNNPKCCDLAACLKGKNYLLDIEAEIPISRQSSPAIVIHNAGKGVSGSGKTIIIYDIKTMVTGQIIESKHRYSDFEGLREIFLSSYNCVVPPIPSKHSVADYASKPGKAKLDVTIIAKRKRMLQTFLLRAASDPILQGSHAFHLFLTDQSPWNTVMKQHLGTIKRPPAVRISSERTLQRPDPRFDSARDYTIRLSNQLVYIKKVFKKIISIYKESSSVFGELGASYNGWSLSPNEEPNSHSIEFIGQTFDSMQPVTAETQQRLQYVGDMFNEYLAFCNVINELLLRRHRVHVSFELCSETLGQKKALLAQLEQSEEQTQRLGAVLAVEGQPSIPLSRPSGILASFNALIDNDPDTARRNNISKTRAIITSLESEREERRIVLLNLNTEIDSSLNYFQAQKIKDFRNGLVRLCMAMKEDCEQNLKFWAECQKVVNNS